jgi:hypothetical protein
MRLRRRSMRTGLVQYAQLTAMFKFDRPYSHQFRWVFEPHNAATADDWPESIVRKLQDNESMESEYVYDTVE